MRGRKNPFMSAWLSGANKVANTAMGAARGRVMAEAKRQQSDMARAMGKAMGSLWSAPLAFTTKKPRKKRK